MTRTTHEWSKEALFAKAQLYADTMIESQESDWQLGLWSAFTLEILLRAAIAHTSPVLLADSKDWNNILYSLNIQPKKSKFVPKSASITELINKIEDICPEFSREHSNFCANHFTMRNTEVHTGDLPFESISTSSWLPMFYSVCAVLAEEINESLETLFGHEAAKQARDDIAALEDGTAKSVKGTIQTHIKTWDLKTENEKDAARMLAETTALRHYGHRANCPACMCTALLQGKAAGEAKRSVDEDKIVERQVIKPETFSCIACGLRISGYSKLLAAGLGDTYISTSRYDAMEYFEIDLDEHVRSMMEDDNNEY